MPKRSTLTYTSEDAPNTEVEDLRVYYCKYSGKSAFVTDCRIDTLPKRKTDNATIIDTSRHMVKLYTTDGGVKLIRRRNGNIERQYRLNIDPLPVAYKSEENGRYLYIMDDAVAEFASAHVEADGVPPIPPCIIPLGDESCEITLEIEDQRSRAKILRISADSVHISIVNCISHDQSNNEIIKLFSKILGCRASQLSIDKGSTTRHKLLIIQNMERKEIYDKLTILCSRNQT